MLLLGTLLSVPTARAQLPFEGPELAVNSYTTGFHEAAAVASTSDDGFIVVWLSRDGDTPGLESEEAMADPPPTRVSGEDRAFVASNPRGYTIDFDVMVRRFDSTGAAVSGEFRANTYTTGSQESTAIAVGADDTFLIVWESSNQDGSGSGIFAQRFASNGAAIGGEFQVNSVTASSQRDPSASIAPSGAFVIVWQGPDAFSTGVFAQRFAANGIGLAGEIAINTYTTGSQSVPVVAHGSDNDFTIVWESDGQDGSGEGIFHRRFDSAGQPLADEMQVNSYTGTDQSLPALAADERGGLLVVWDDSGLDRIAGQRLNRFGFKTGEEIEFAADDGQQRFRQPSAASTGGSGFIVGFVRRDLVDPMAEDDVYAQRLSADGTLLGRPFQINTYTTGDQEHTVVAADRDGDVVVAWSGPKGLGDVVAVRRLLGEVPGFLQPSTLQSPGFSDPDVASLLADDFLIQEAARMNQLTVCGGYSPSSEPFEDMFLIRDLVDNGGLPGSEAFSLTNQVPLRRSTGRTGVVDEYCFDFTFPFFGNPILDDRHHWIEISNDSSASAQDFVCYGGSVDATSGRTGGAASANGISWGAGSDRAIEIPFRRFETPEATFVWAEPLWSRELTQLERFDTTPANVALADQVPATPPLDAALGTGTLTFNSANTGLSRSFTVMELEPFGPGWIYADSDIPQGRFALSPNGSGDFKGMSAEPRGGSVSHNDDFDILIDSGPPLTAFGMTVVNESGAGMFNIEALEIYGPGDALIAEIDFQRMDFNRQLTFLGVLTDQPITRIHYEDSTEGDDIAVQHFRFGVNRSAAEPIFADGFESGDTMAWSATTP